MLIVKRFCILVWCVLLLGCNGENVPNCFQNAGEIITREFDLGDFDKITVFERIELILIEGPEFKVQLQTGEFLENDISAKVEDGRLLLKNENACNITRDYGITKFYVTSPNLTEIRNSSGLTVSNQGVLTYPNITLISEDFGREDEFHTDGHYRLKIDSEKLVISANNLSHMFIEGAVELINLNIYSGDARFQFENLIAQNANIYHRGTNDAILNVVESIKGELRSTGDLILIKEPASIEVDALYTGKVIIGD